MPHVPKTGRVYKYMDLEFYAQDGFCRIHDNRDGKSTDKNPADFLEHAFGLAAAIPRMSSWREKYECAEMANKVEACCKEAVDMGSPFDPRAVAFYQRHKSYKRPYVQAPSGTPSIPGTVTTDGGLIVPSRQLVQAKRR